MEITKDVIRDLLPLYLANELSEDTRALVEEYLQTDPELAQIAERHAATNLPQDIPMSITQETQLEAYKETKKYMLLRTLVIAAIIAFSLCALLGGAAFIALVASRIMF